MKFDEEYWNLTFTIFLFGTIFWSFGMAAMDSTSTVDEILPFGAIFGVVFALSMSWQFVATEIKGKVINTEKFKSDMRIEMAKKSFELEKDLENYMVFKLATLFSSSIGSIKFLPGNLNKVTVSFHGEKVFIVGPYYRMKQYKKSIFSRLLDTIE